MNKEAIKVDSPLVLLLAAKQYSDRKEYDMKNQVMSGMLSKQPDDFLVDDSSDQFVYGLTHKPTGFRMHLPRQLVDSVAPQLLIKTAASVEAKIQAAVPSTVTAPTKGTLESIYDKWHGMSTTGKVLTAIPVTAAALMTTALLTATTAYLVNPKKTKRFLIDKAYNALASARSGLDKGLETIPESKYANISGAISPSTGLGMTLGYKKFPIKAKADLTGGGLVYSLPKEHVLSLMRSVPGIPDKFIKGYEKIGPPNVYAGAEFSVMTPFNPIALGIEVNKDNVKEVKKDLGAYMRALKAARP